MFKFLFVLLVTGTTSINAEALKIEDCSGSYKEILKCEKRIEERLANKYPNLIERKGDDLILKNIKSVNQPKILTNGELEYTLVEHHYYQNISRINIRGYEYMDSYVYHHLYGMYVQVFGDIKFSDNSLYMLGFSEDLNAGFAPNAVGLFRLGNWLTLMTVFYPGDFGIIDAKFLSDEKVKLVTITENTDVIPYEKIKGECVLKRYNSIWQFENPMCYQTQRKQR